MSAERELIVVSPYFVPRKSGVEFFSAIQARGVQVTIVTNSLAANNQVTVHGGYAPSRKPLLESGVRIFEVRPDANVKGSEIVAASGAKATLHTKAFLVDRQTIFIGSFNFDPRSANLNTESGVIIESKGLGKEFGDTFDRGIKSQTYELFLNDDGKLRSRGFEDGRDVIYKKEPKSTWGQRFIAGALLLSAQSGYRSSCAIATALAGERGKAYADMSIATIRSVSKGVVGVAIIQALLAGIGLVVMDVPAAGIWAALVLVLAVVQLPPLLVLGPVAVWVFSVADPVPATIFAIYAVLVSLCDSALKPLFLGKGMNIPTLVILIGARGGAILAGLLGLFLGPIVLAVGYTIVTEWMAVHAPAESEQD